ncbi:MAG: 23S rRNA (adenine(2503)-C(2))-methyltransferase RlmN, partial [Candidatus Cloacimonas sp.]
MKKNVFSFLPADLAENIISLQPDIPVYRTKQILSWLYKSLINDPDAMTNLPQ